MDPRLRALVLASVVATAWPSAQATGQSTDPFIRPGSGAVAGSRDVAVVRQRSVAVASPARLASPDASQVLELDLFQDVRLRAHRTRLDAVPGGATWTGRVEGYPGSSAVFAAVDDVVAGHVSVPFGFFAVSRQPNGEYLVRQLDESRRDPQPDDSIETPEPAVAPGESSARLRGGALQDTGDLIDVMAVVSKDAVTGFGGQSNARASLELAMAETNEAFRTSGVSTALRLVHVEYVDYTERQHRESLAPLQELQNPSDGVLDEVHTLRDRHAADLVVLVLEVPGTDAYGTAYINSPGSRGAYGFSVISRGELNEDRLLPHEIGHNLGLRHDWYVDASAGRVLSFGKGFTSLPGRFRDIMSYSDLCRATNTSCARVLAFSNPGLSHQGQLLGVPIGTSASCQVRVRPLVDCDADAATALTVMAPVVARFRDSRAAVTARRLLPGDAARSPSGRYRLLYQVDGDLVLSDDELGRVEWSTKTAGTVAGEVAMTPDGELAVVDAGGTVRWRSGAAGYPNAYFDVTDDGTVAVFRVDGGLVWSSRTGAAPAGPARDSVTVLSFSPTNGTVLQAGQTVGVTTTARYALTSADEGLFQLQAQDDTGQSLAPILTVPSTGRSMRLERGSGEATFAMSFVVPAGISRITMFVLLYPDDQERSSAFVSYSFPVR